MPEGGGFYIMSSPLIFRVLEFRDLKGSSCNGWSISIDKDLLLTPAITGSDVFLFEKFCMET